MSKIARLFDDIAPRYDFLNHLLSCNIDKIWRRKALRGHIDNNVGHVLDVACGTGDFALQVIRCGGQHVTGIDLSEKMLEIGRQKIRRQHLDERIEFLIGDGAHLPFGNDYFDAATIAFGVRNFEERESSLREIWRVLKPGAPLIILEFSQPQKFPIKQFYHFYFQKILPFIGGKISGFKAAYQYLPNSVYTFPQGEKFMQELKDAGFSKLKQKRFTFGIATAYYGVK